MTKRFTLPLLHILTWILILFFPIYVLQRNQQLQIGFYYPYLVRICFFALLFYANLFFFIPRFFARKAFIRFALITLILSALLVVAHNHIREIIISNITPPPVHNDRVLPPLDGFNLRIYADYALYILITGLSIAIWLTSRWIQDSLRLEKQQSKLLEANLRNLRNQLNPHFLFNTLNNIYSLIAINPSQAQESVHRLSGLLRYVLYENEDPDVPIEKELDFTRSYIDLMRLRLRKHMVLDVRIQNHGYTKGVAPLMFMTIIENAFKHSNTNSAGELYIHIYIDVHPVEGISCLVSNSKGEQSTEVNKEASGIGLENLQQRLQLLYPKQHNLKIEQTDTTYSVALRIDI